MRLGVSKYPGHQRWVLVDKDDEEKGLVCPLHGVAQPMESASGIMIRVYPTKEHDFFYKKAIPFRDATDELVTKIMMAPKEHCESYSGDDYRAAVKMLGVEFPPVVLPNDCQVTNVPFEPIEIAKT